MADRDRRLPRNAPGRFYVDDTCIDCDLCRGMAPATFGRDEPGGTSFVHRQPVTPEELAKAEEALEACPTSTIGNDG